MPETLMGFVLAFSPGHVPATDTLTGSRGIVSKADFEVLEKGGRPQSGSAKGHQRQQQQHQPGASIGGDRYV